MEVPTICKAYFLGLCKRIYPQNIALYGTVTPFEDLGIPIDQRVGHKVSNGLLIQALTDCMFSQEVNHGWAINKNGDRKNMIPSGKPQIAIENGHGNS